MDGLLRAARSGIGISKWISAQEPKKNELMLKTLEGEQVIQTDAYLQEGFQEEKETISNIHTIAFFYVFVTFLDKNLPIQPG